MQILTKYIPLFFTTCQYGLKYIHQYEANKIKYRPIQAQIQSNTSTTNYIIVFNACFSIRQYSISMVKSGAPARTAAPSSTGVSEVSELSKPYTAARHLVVGIQLLGFVRQPNFARSSIFLER